MDKLKAVAIKCMIYKTCDRQMDKLKATALDMLDL